MIVEGGHGGQGNHDGEQGTEEEQKKKLLGIVERYILDAFGNPVYPKSRIPDMAQVIYVLPELQRTGNSISLINQNPDISGIESIPARRHFRLVITKNFYRDAASGIIYSKESVSLGMVSERGFLGFDDAHVLEWDYTGDVTLSRLYKKEIPLRRKRSRRKTVLTSDPKELTIPRLRYFANALDYVFEGDNGTLADGEKVYPLPHTYGTSTN